MASQHLTKRQAKRLAEPQGFKLPQQGYEMQYNGFIIANHSHHKHLPPYYLFGYELSEWDNLVELMGEP